MNARPSISEFERVSFAVVPDDIEALRRLARAHQRSLSGEIRTAIVAWIERCEQEEATA
jgi:hypothetical protein